LEGPRVGVFFLAIGSHLLCFGVAVTVITNRFDFSLIFLLSLSIEIKAEGVDNIFFLY